MRTVTFWAESWPRQMSWGLCSRACSAQYQVRSAKRARRVAPLVCVLAATTPLLAMMEAQITKVAELLHEAAETHHAVYRIVDGADDDWASWYGDWLVRLSELPQLLGAPPVRSELVYLLVGLDKQYVERKPAEPWERYYARAILEHFSKPAERRST